MREDSERAKMLILFQCISLFLSAVADSSAGVTVSQLDETMLDGYVTENPLSGTSNCNPNPCRNGGMCKKLPYSYQCFCPVGYIGSTCETSVMEVCDNQNPCLNGGSCVERRGSHPQYVCYCPNGYAGLKCEREIDVCDPNPCFNNGVCSKENGTHYFCYCPPGFSGFHCENGENYRCDFEHGFCDMLTNDYRNSLNWTLQHGRSVSEPSEDHTLRHVGKIGHFAYLPLSKGREIGRAVLLSPWMYSKHCIKFWYNANMAPRHLSEIHYMSRFNVLTRYPYYAEIRRHTIRSESNGWRFVNFTETTVDGFPFRIIFAVLREPIPFEGHVAIDDIELIKGDCSSPEATDVCTPNPCQNGALCERREGFDYACYCPHGYGGLFCEKEFDPCSTQPCYYGSTCHKKDGMNFVCSCPSNATGSRCEEEMGNICSFNPCKNGGTCRKVQYGYRCDCTKWYTGEKCTENKWCVDGPGKVLCPEGACAFDHENEIGYCKWRE